MAYPKEGVEALTGFLALATVLAEHFKDGVQVEDLGPVLAKLQSEEVKAKLVAAYNGIELVPSEVKEIELMDVLVVLPSLVPEIMKLMQALKK
jgi:hypothetical protein